MSLVINMTQIRVDCFEAPNASELAVKVNAYFRDEDFPSWIVRQIDYSHSAVVVGSEVVRTFTALVTVQVIEE